MKRLVFIAFLMCLAAWPGMGALEVVGGSADLLVLVKLYATDGTAKTGLLYSDMTITYTRNNGSADVDITEATMTMGTHADGGFIEVDATNSPGLYQFGVPDAAIADGAEEVVLNFKASGVVPYAKTVALVDVNLRNGANVAANTVLIEGSDATDTLGTAQTGDAFARLGAPAGASVSADVAAVKSETATILADTGELQTNQNWDVWDDATRVLTAGTNIALAKGVGVTGFNDLSAAQVNAEADTALADYDPPTRTELTSDTNSVLSKLLKYVQLLARSDAAIGTDNATELMAINADGGSGAGDFSNQADALESAADKVDVVDGIVDAILLDTAEIGAAGAGLTEAGGTGDQLTALSTLDAAGVRSAVGLASANLDTQIAALPTAAETSDQVWTEAIADHSGTAGSTAEALSNATAPAASAVADAVWTELIADHSGTSGSTAEQLAAAGAGGDPWATALPGAYTSGQAGEIIGNFLENFVSEDLTASTITTGSAADLIGRAEQGGGLTVVGSSFTDDDGDDLYFKTSGGVGIPGAVVRAIPTASYPAPASLAGVPRTTTGNDGGLSASFYLDSGSYTIEWRHPSYAVHTTTITVP